MTSKIRAKWTKGKTLFLSGSEAEGDPSPAVLNILAKRGEGWIFEHVHHELVQNGFAVFKALCLVLL